ncbi:MAG: YncE family protein [Myxococcaceae bacterium]
MYRLLLLAASTLTSTVALGQPDAGSVATLPIHALRLLPSSPGRIGMDYLGYEPGTNQVWVPGGLTGRVFVVDANLETIRTIEGFATRQRDGRELGPSSVTFGPGRAFIGNRADSSVCAVDLRTLQRGECVALPEAPDGLAYVATTDEVWATLPIAKALVILSAAKAGLPIAGHIELPGEPEGYAVDAARGRFYTNLRDRNQTLVLDVHKRATAAHWPTTCSAEGPRGMTLDATGDVLVVACTDRLLSFAVNPVPTLLGRLETGAGLDNIDLAPKLGTVFAAAGKAELLTRAELLGGGALSATGQAHTASGVQGVVVSAAGKAFAADSAAGQLWVAGP